MVKKSPRRPRFPKGDLIGNAENAIVHTHPRFSLESMKVSVMVWKKPEKSLVNDIPNV